MPLPTTPILSSPNIANENPISESGAWSPTPIHPAASTLIEAVSTQFAANGAIARSYYNQLFSIDQEAYCTLNVMPSGSGSANGLFCRIQNPGTASIDAYAGFYSVLSPAGWRIFKVTNGSFSQLGGTTASVAAVGDGMWLNCVGNVITLYQISGGVGTARVTFTDNASPILAQGPIGLEIDDTSSRMTSFGGGSLGQLKISQLALTGVGL